MRNKQIYRLARGNLSTMVVAGTGVLGRVMRLRARLLLW